jgi:hypothetical protein
MCLPAAIGPESSETYFPAGIPDGVVQVTESSDEKTKEEFLDLLARSFAGTTTAAPEPILSWGFTEESSPEQDALNDKQHTSPLSAEASKERLTFFKFTAEFCFTTAARHGGCYALKNEQGKLVAATVTFPPNDKNLHDAGACEMMFVLGKLNMPSQYSSGNTAVKCDRIVSVFKEAHKEHASIPHIYVYMFACDPEHQRKGYGRRLAEIMNSAGDSLQVPMYLETAGTANEKFYGLNGYELKKRHKLEVAINKRVDAFKVDGNQGVAAMVRTPVAPNAQ